MVKPQLDTSRVEEIAERFQGVVNNTLGDVEKELLTNMLDDERFGPALLMAPASTRTEYHYCYPGGLAEHSLDVAVQLNRLADSLCPAKYDFKRLTFLALVHDLGKAGDGVNEYYSIKNSDWHQKQGICYEINSKCQVANVAHRTLFLLQKWGYIFNNFDEYLALLLVETDPKEMPDIYRYNTPELVSLLNWANTWSINSYKEKK